MVSSFSAAVITSSVTFFVFLFLRYEQKRNIRYLGGMRRWFDRLFSSIASAYRAHIPHLNNSFARRLFHYIMHKVLSMTLHIVRNVEAFLIRIVRFNRAKALRVVHDNAGSHLHAIAQHKEETSLTDRERRKRKDDALRGEL